MRPSTIIFALVVVVCTVAMAQQPEAITPGILKELESSCVQDDRFLAMHHALVQTDGRKLALNSEPLIKVDSYFSNELSDEKITDQKASGRCWMFSGLNIFRREAAAALKSEEFEFSQSYLFFFDKLEKANIFLDAIARTRERPYTDRYVEWLMRTPIQEGGNWLGFVELVKKYGAVPKDVMPETFNSSNSGPMNEVLALRLKVAAVMIRTAANDSVIAALRMQTLKDVYRILALNLGVPPGEFQWRYETKERALSPLRHIRRSSSITR